MDSAQHLAVIDQLCSRAFPGQRGPTDVGTAGPGWFIAELATSHGLREGDPGEREPAAADFHALKDAVARALDRRRGAHQRPWGTQGLRLRAGWGEEIPEPWGTVSVRVEELELWDPDDTGRWIALGVADRDAHDEIQLLAVVTDIDPP
ncbi:hypothetical protein ACF1AX_06200 [Streptomyces sp. NPDC014802]|uniref:hypothetical protein n=1 Tax=unclassified Streptomyces TaxID=2593676 RepID=UPI0036F94F7F